MLGKSRELIICRLEYNNQILFFHLPNKSFTLLKWTMYSSINKHDNKRYDHIEQTHYEKPSRYL